MCTHIRLSGTPSLTCSDRLSDQVVCGTGEARAEPTDSLALSTLPVASGQHRHESPSGFGGDESLQGTECESPRQSQEEAACA